MVIGPLQIICASINRSTSSNSSITNSFPSSNESDNISLHIINISECEVLSNSES